MNKVVLVVDKYFQIKMYVALPRAKNISSDDLIGTLGFDLVSLAI